MPGLSYTAQAGTTLEDFVAAGGVPLIEDLGGNWERVTIVDPAGSGSPVRFGRVVVTLDPP